MGPQTVESSPVVPVSPKKVNGMSPMGKRTRLPSFQALRNLTFASPPRPSGRKRLSRQLRQSSSSSNSTVSTVDSTSSFETQGLLVSAIEIANSDLSPTQNSTKKDTRKVRFDFSRTTYHESDLVLTPVDCRTGWWSRTEFDRITMLAAKSIQSFERRRQDLIEMFGDLVEKCNACSHENMPGQLCQLLKRMAKTSDIRGMESDVVPFLKTQREQHVWAVLSVANKVESKGSLSADMRARMIRNRSLHSSRTLRLLAQVVAASDADEAK